MSKLSRCQTRRMTYLGKEVSPEQYYLEHSCDYENPQADAVEVILRSFLPYFGNGTILDIGCGDGLATKIMRPRLNNLIIGVDSSPAMIDRYSLETESRGVVAHFWETLPRAKYAVACHSLHLCPDSYKHMVEFRLKEAGVKTLIVTSPLKSVMNGFSFPILRQTVSASGSSKKTVWGWVVSIP